MLKNQEILPTTDFFNERIVDYFEEGKNVDVSSAKVTVHRNIFL